MFACFVCHFEIFQSAMPFCYAFVIVGTPLMSAQSSEQNYH
jgi:hypothetical protein